MPPCTIELPLRSHALRADIVELSIEVNRLSGLGVFVFVISGLGGIHRRKRERFLHELVCHLRELRAGFGFGLLHGLCCNESGGEKQQQKNAYNKLHSASRSRIERRPTPYAAVPGVPCGASDVLATALSLSEWPPSIACMAALGKATR